MVMIINQPAIIHRMSHRCSHGPIMIMCRQNRNQSIYVEEEPLYDSNIDMSGAVDETLSKVISIYNGNSDAKN